MKIILVFSDDLTHSQAYYSLVDEMAELAHQIEGADYHPVSVMGGEVIDVGSADLGSRDQDLPNVDMWGDKRFSW